MKIQISKSRLFALSFLSVFYLNLILYTHPVMASDEPENISSFGNMALLPFTKGDFIEKLGAQNISPLSCPIDQVCIDLSEGDETLFFMEKLDKRLQDIFKNRLDSNLFPVDETAKQNQLLPVNRAKDTLLSHALALADQLKVDYVLVPLLWSYSERIGNQFSAEKPASVALTLYLVSAKEKKRVWAESIDKTQQSLTDNLLNAKELIKLGGKWATAAELAEAGMLTILNDFPLKSPIIK
nr:hypothetical protein [Desulfobulbaceae bacterium]